MKNELYGFQEEAVSFLVRRKYALLALDMGMGKTIIAVMSAEKLKFKRILVICPASVKYVWEKEIRKWTGEQLVQTIVSGKDKVQGARWHIVNYDLLLNKKILCQLLGMKYDLIIFDEAHYLKNAQAKRTKIVYYPKGLKDRTDRVWLLTGTPVLNRPVELFTHLSSLVPERLGEYKNYMAFCERYCDASYRVVVPERRDKNNQIVRPEKRIYDVSGSSNIKELSNVLAGFMLRRMKEEVLPELPAIQFQNIYIKGDKNKLKKEKVAYDTQDQILGEYSTLRRENGLAKVKDVVLHVKDVLETKQKIVIFGYHRDVIHQITEELSGYGACEITGSTPTPRRTEILHKFVNEERNKVLVGQIQTLGTGVDGLQDVCDTVIFAEMSWVPGEIDQAVDRLHRIGQKNKVLVQFIVAEGSVDEDIAILIANKKRVIRELVKKTAGIVEESLGRIRKVLEGICG